MPNVPGLRSPYSKVGRLVYFGRMIDKIRLHARGALPADYIKNLGKAFDARACTFLRIPYDELTAHVLSAAAPDDAAALAWAEKTGGARSDEDCEIWCGFMMKRGWRDVLTERLQLRIKESGLEDKPIETMFDYIEFDEDRDPVANRFWEQ